MPKKVMLFTGSTGRLGTAFASRYSDDYTIVGVARRHPDELLTEDFIKGDVNVDAEKIINVALNRHGRVDVLVNAAVYYLIKSTENINPGEMVNSFRTNVVAPQNLAKKLLIKFWKQHLNRNKIIGRNVINIGSWSAHHYYPEQGAYAASKAALHMLTQHMSKEFSPYNIKVGLLKPTTLTGEGAVNTVADALAELERNLTSGHPHAKALLIKDI